MTFSINFEIFLFASIVSRSLRFFAVAALVFFFGEVAKGFIDRHLGWLTVAFVILVIGGFWIVGRKARFAARSASD